MGEIHLPGRSYFESLTFGSTDDLARRLAKCVDPYRSTIIQGALTGAVFTSSLAGSHYIALMLKVSGRSSVGRLYGTSALLTSSALAG